MRWLELEESIPQELKPAFIIWQLRHD